MHSKDGKEMHGGGVYIKVNFVVNGKRGFRKRATGEFVNLHEYEQRTVGLSEAVCELSMYMFVWLFL